ncbi:MAG: hypothetical protein ACOC1X_01780 [Promethearchaeota archaeon]
MISFIEVDKDHIHEAIIIGIPTIKKANAIPTIVRTNCNIPCLSFGLAIKVPNPGKTNMFSNKEVSDMPSPTEVLFSIL